MSWLEKSIMAKEGVAKGVKGESHKITMNRKVSFIMCMVHTRNLL